MSDTSSMPATQPAPDNESASQLDAVKVVYLLYFAGFFVPLAAAAGLIVAYLKIDSAAAVAATHFRFQIRTFWIGLLYLIIGGLLVMVLVGYLVLLWWGIWTLIRCIKGFLLISDKKAVPEPATWMW